MTNIANILRHCAKGTDLYSPICGDCYLLGIKVTRRSEECTIIVASAYPPENDARNTLRFNERGRLMVNCRNIFEKGDCMLWPSAECQDWDDVEVEYGRIKINSTYPASIL